MAHPVYRLIIYILYGVPFSTPTLKNYLPYKIRQKKIVGGGKYFDHATPYYSKSHF